MKVELFTADLPGGWHPEDLSNFLGGNEESAVLWAEALARHKFEVHVFTSLKAESGFERNDVHWHPRKDFRIDADHEALVTFKDRQLWFRGMTAKKRIHWSNDVEARWSAGALAAIDNFICLGTYHRERLAWLPEEKITYIPLGMDMRPSQKTGKKDADLCIYMTSPDRGLETLLEDWPRIKRHYPSMKLFVSYGWENVDKWGGDPGQQLKARIQHRLMELPDVKFGSLDQEAMHLLMRTATYYIHPLNRADSDLFGFGLMKARAFGCKIVVPSVARNGFRDMVKEYIPYRDFISGHRESVVKNSQHAADPASWEKIIVKHWIPLLRGAA